MAGRNSIGALDQRVTFQEETTDDDGQGGRENSAWANISTAPTMWAEVEQGAGSEGEIGEHRQSNTYPITIRVRNRNDLTAKMAVVWRGRRYNIRSVPPYDARNEFLEIEAENGVPL